MKKREVQLICHLDKKWNPRNVRIKRIGGQTNRNFVVVHSGKKFFVRLPWEGLNLIDRMIEGRNIEALAKSKKLKEILPRYYAYILKGKNILAPMGRGFFNVPDGTMLTEYIEGQELNGRLLEKKEIRETLVKTLHAFHTSGVRFQNQYDVFRDEIEKYRTVAERYPLSTVIDEKTLSQMKRMESVGKKKFLGGGGISTHNDLEFENLLLGRDGKIYLLDFEYAGFNTRGGVHYDFGTLLGDNLFHRYPLSLELFDQIRALANKTCQQKLEKEQILYGALADFLVMFWWALAKYFTAETQKEKKYLIEHAMQGVRGMERLLPLLKEKRKGQDFS